MKLQNMLSRLLTSVLFLVCLQLFAQKPPVYATKDGAVAGYDPVAYFLLSQPTKGSSELAYIWNDATWHFSSAEHLALFKSNPEKYAPKYGGYCSYAVANGYTAKIDPEAWKIVDEKLYLNYSKKIKVKWEEKQNKYIEKAEKNWPGVLD